MEYKIEYQDITPNINSLRLRQQFDNDVYNIQFVFNQFIFGVNISNYKCYVKVDTTLLKCAEKEELKPSLLEDKLIVNWSIKQNVSQWQRVNVQVSFEELKTNKILNTKIITLYFDKSINADKEIEETYPSVLNQHELRIEKLEGQSHIEQFENYLAFPTSGNENICYVDKKTNKFYRWDSKELKYYCIGSDYNQIELVNGGNL